MQEIPIKKEEIERYKQDEDIVRQTAQQIIKDFAQFGMEIHFSGNLQMAYDELFAQTKKHITNLLDSNYPKLLTLLYQIDLNSNKIAKEQALNEELTEAELLTKLIIERELLKVLFRIYYKEKGGL
jgi:hypothetical protein